MVVVVLGVVVLSVGILHHGQAALILRCRREVEVIAADDILVGNHAGVDVGLVEDVLAARELLAELLLAEVAGVVEHDVENDLDALLVRLVDEGLEVDVARAAAVVFSLALMTLVAQVYLRHVHGMVAVVVVARRVLHHGGDPDGSEAKRLDVVELVDQSGKVATPARVARLDLFSLVVPTEHVVVGVAVVETGGDDEIDRLVAEVSSIGVEVASGIYGRRQACRRHKRQKHFLEVVFIHRCIDVLFFRFVAVVFTRPSPREEGGTSQSNVPPSIGNDWSIDELLHEYPRILALSVLHDVNARGKALCGVGNRHVGTDESAVCAIHVG